MRLLPRSRRHAGFASRWRAPKRRPSSSPASATRSTSRIRRSRRTARPGDGVAEFTLPGETVDDWSKLFAYHAYPEMGDDPVAAVKMVGKVVKETNKDANFAIIENEKTGEAIIDFLTWAPESDVMEFNVFKYARAADGKGLVAMQYAQHIKLGDIDVEGMRALRARSVEDMADDRHFPGAGLFRPQAGQIGRPMQRKMGSPPLHALVATTEKR